LFLVMAGLALSVSADSDTLLGSLQPRGHVSDFAGVFEPASRDSLEQYLLSVKTLTGSEIAVVTLPSLEGGEIGDFANRLFERWGIGQKDKGALLLTALEERDVRIEVGYGLEGILTDARTGRILDESVIPRFKEGQYAAGLADGAAALARFAAEESGVSLTGAPPAGVTSTGLAALAASRPASSGGMAGLIFVFLFIGFFAALILWARKHGRGGTTPSDRPRFTSSGGGISGSSGSGGSGGFSGFSGGRSGGGGASRSW